jgi:hypothetical protein
MQKKAMATNYNLEQAAQRYQDCFGALNNSLHNWHIRYYAAAVLDEPQFGAQIEILYSECCRWAHLANNQQINESAFARILTFATQVEVRGDVLLEAWRPLRDRLFGQCFEVEEKVVTRETQCQIIREVSYIVTPKDGKVPPEWTTALGYGDENSILTCLSRLSLLNHAGLSGLSANLDQVGAEFEAERERLQKRAKQLQKEAERHRLKSRQHTTSTR